MESARIFRGHLREFLPHVGDSSEIQGGRIVVHYTFSLSLTTLRHDLGESWASFLEILLRVANGAEELREALMDFMAMTYNDGLMRSLTKLRRTLWKVGLPDFRVILLNQTTIGSNSIFLAPCRSIGRSEFVRISSSHPGL